MEGGIFKSTEARGFARGMAIMNSKSSKTFRWSVRLTYRYCQIYIGFASRLERKDDWIDSYDENSIFFYPPLEKYIKDCQRVFQAIAPM